VPDKSRLIYRLTEDFEYFHEGKVEAEVKAENISSVAFRDIQRDGQLNCVQIMSRCEQHILHFGYEHRFD
jgi:hypothetical protein